MISTRSAILTFTLAFILAFAVAGCATGPVSVADSRPVKSKRLLADYAFYDHPVHHGAKLLIIRDGGRFDEPEDAQVLVDGRAVAFLRPGERVEVYVYAGDRLLGAGSRFEVFAAPLVTRPFRFAAGRTYVVRVGIRGGQFDVYPAATQEK